MPGSITSKSKSSAAPAAPATTTAKKDSSKPILLTGIAVVAVVAILAVAGLVFAFTGSSSKGSKGLYGPASELKSGILKRWAKPKNDYVEVECYDKGSSGRSYVGTKSKTRGGHQCRVWRSQSPTPHNFKPEDFQRPEDFDNNYCRNPAIHWGISYLWCYTNADTPGYERCKVPKCYQRAQIKERTPRWVAPAVTQAPVVQYTKYEGKSDNCYDATTFGKWYRGTVSTTETGYDCKPWTSSRAGFIKRFFTNVQGYSSVSEVRNYCRNPSSRMTFIWCYSKGPLRFEACKIAPCGEAIDPWSGAYKVNNYQCIDDSQKGCDRYQIVPDAVVRWGSTMECTEMCDEDPSCGYFEWHATGQCELFIKNCNMFPTHRKHKILDTICRRV